MPSGNLLDLFKQPNLLRQPDLLPHETKLILMTVAQSPKRHFHRFLLSLSTIVCVISPILLKSQGSIPVFLGQTQTMLAPTVDASGRTIVFGSAITSDGTNVGTVDLYSISPDGSALRKL